MKTKAVVQLSPELQNRLVDVLSTGDVRVLLDELGRLAKESSSARNDLNAAIINGVRGFQEALQRRSVTPEEIENLGGVGQAELTLIREAAIGSLIITLSCALLVPEKAASLLSASTGLLGVVFGSDLFPGKKPWDPEELAKLLGMK